jgi:ribonucleoside-diphosphate reductase beta chain
MMNDKLTEKNMTAVAAAYAEAVDWNNLPDEMDKIVWEQLIKQFWVDTAAPISNDLVTWNKLLPAERELVRRVFTGLTLLDTIQGTVGAPALMKDARTPHEQAVLSNIAFMEAVHAKSYSTIFQTLATERDIREAFRWSRENDHLQFKARRIQEIYATGSAMQKKIASVFLESFLFYSGFYLPLWFNGHAKLTNTAHLIRLIIRDEAVHGFYVGYKFQQSFEELKAAEREKLTDWAFDLIQELYDNEVRYTQDLYDEHGLTEDVKAFLRYNANKALMNLGFDPLFPKEDVNPVVISGLSLGAETHDFFSGKGSYAVAKAEISQDEDWAEIVMPEPVVDIDDEVEPARV